MARFARIGAGWIATCLLGGFFGLIAAISGWDNWWAAPLGILAALVMAIGLIGLVAEASTWLSRRKPPDVVALRALAQEGHKQIEANADLRAGVPNAEARSNAFRLWMERWEPKVEAALGADSATLALFKRDVDTAGMHWIDRPVHRLTVKLDRLQTYVGGSLTADAQKVEAHAEPAKGTGEALDASVTMTSSLSHLVIPGPGNPTLHQVGYQTEGRRHFAYGALKRRPKAIRFSKPEDRLVRSADLPFEMRSGSGQIIVEKFYDDGVVIDEVGSVGDPVTFVAYFDD